MLCAASLAALQSGTPVEQRPLPPSEDVASTDSSASVPSLSTASEDVPVYPDATISTVGIPRDFSGHADGTTRAYDSIEKWIMAALRALEKETDDIIMPDYEPNDALCSEIHSTIAEWRTAGTIARDAGVIDERIGALTKSPPQECLVKVRGWLTRFINQRRAEPPQRLKALPEKWARDLAGRKADARAVNKAVKQAKAESGKLYHHKHDLAPSQEQLVDMCYVGWSGDQHVEGDILDALEAGMAVALYLPTGARGSELKKMHLQSLGHECIQDEASGLSFESFKLTAFETKTKAQHLNQILPHSNPWRCGIGLLGISLLVRRKLYGTPPFSMQTNDQSWTIIGTNTGTLDRRISNVFEVAGVRRQKGDPLTYLGRHYGTRLLQHAGGSAEGGAARRGHSNGTASHHYTECPLPDLLRLAGNNADKPFVPAHLHAELYVLADAVLLILFPELEAHEKKIDARQIEVSAMHGDIIKIRTEEMLNDQERLVRSIRMACRIALCCLVARPRTWKQWAILEHESTIWQRAMEKNHRVVATLFAGNKDAIDAMEKLALEVIRLEQAEIIARKASPENAITSAVVSAVREVRQEAADDRAKFQAVLEQLANMNPADGATERVLTISPPPSEERPDQPPPVIVPASTGTGTGARLKHKRENQDDVICFSTWSDIGKAIDYARKELAPQEKEHGRSWRVLTRSDGREDKSRDKQWRCYVALATAIGLLTRDGKSYDDAVATLQARLDAFGAKAHTPLLRAIGEEIKNVRDKDAVAKEILGH